MKCPLCGEPHPCGIESKQESCWCFHVSIPEQLLDALPEEERRKSCICKNCVDRAST